MIANVCSRQGTLDKPVHSKMISALQTRGRWRGSNPRQNCREGFPWNVPRMIKRRRREIFPTGDKGIFAKTYENAHTNRCTYGC
ncbi:hypothetical protein PoB_003127600 [Plakobranchus ocellatus]|uniref:Uncharacterized protein n=1 Tax=Plakobranchus ocellatus TaxID=259542 RepID=A0AAV4ADQ2_9GAST|nr:hypothetical protein PoB_003127600 [Plakobranchus ocellatus]